VTVQLQHQKTPNLTAEKLDKNKGDMRFFFTFLFLILFDSLSTQFFFVFFLIYVGLFCVLKLAWWLFFGCEFAWF